MAPAELHRLLMRAALSFGHIFAWLFAFQYFYLTYDGSVEMAFFSVLLAYALTQVITVLLTPWSAKRMRHGVRGSMIMATISMAIAFGFLAAGIGGMLVHIGWGVLAFSIFMGVYRALYWIPYELTATSMKPFVHYLIAALPMVAGILLAWKVPPQVLLFATTVAALIAIIPLSAIKNVHEGYTWKYRETFHVLFDRAHRTILKQSIVEGIEATALLLMWPIAVFVLLEWSYGLLGIVLAFTMFASLTIKHILRSFKTTEVPVTVEAALAGSAWVMRLLVATPLGVVLVDSYFHGSKPSARGHDIEGFEHAAENKTYVDEFTALKEIGMGMGRIIAALLGAALLYFLSFSAAITTVFVLAAISAVYAVYLARSPRRVIA